MLPVAPHLQSPLSGVLWCWVVVQRPACSHLLKGRWDFPQNTVTSHPSPWGRPIVCNNQAVRGIEPFHQEQVDDHDPSWKESRSALGPNTQQRQGKREWVGEPRRWVVGGRWPSYGASSAGMKSRLSATQLAELAYTSPWMPMAMKSGWRIVQSPSRERTTTSSPSGTGTTRARAVRR